ncbi:hypothetical protein NM688_g8261 [Phlebia brevispora]|uniref:Uncharacterized protein n=1 Tax=Phlebia brevispora TaxID=194682 RepID=A0ACC1RV88_9APHY|nr:hypothetical protein NM688_g8261 [Phlebia brevispora]
MPLKHVPATQRPTFTNSPSMNFERPFVGWRPELPGMYQLTPNRSGSMYSFNSGKESNSRPASPIESPAPRGDKYSRNRQEKSEISFGENGTGLGFSFRELSGQSIGDSLDKISRSLSSTSLEQAREASWRDSPSNPDLTFGTVGELSPSPSLETPVLNSSLSSDSMRKAQSMHIRKAPASRYSVDSDTIDPADLSISDLRRMRSKTLVDTVFTKGKGRLHKQRRHAIYADAAMQLALSPPKPGGSFPFPIAVVVSSEGDDAMNTVDTQLDDISDDARWNGLPLSDSMTTLHKSYQRILQTVDSSFKAEAASNTRSAKSTHLLTVPSTGDWHSGPDFLPVFPLRIVKKRTAVTRSHSSRNLTRAIKPEEPRFLNTHHPIVAALIQDLDIAINEWKIMGRF